MSDMNIDEMPSGEAPRSVGRNDDRFVHRHRLSTRIWHWTNAITLLVLLMSGLMIFNAHPRLYWGHYGANADPAWLEIGSNGDEGFVRIGPATVTSTGVLGSWEDDGGRTRHTAFPSWITIPSAYDLAMARRWHLTLAWVFAIGILIYGLQSVFNGHLRRDLLPRRAELHPAHLWADVRDHARLRFPRGETARDYTVLQKLAYVGVLVVHIPLMVLTGMTMSPSLDASWPWLLDVFGGRQSARSIHFIGAWLLVIFVIVHLLMVLLAGPWNEIRSMVTGRFRLPEERKR